jgi:hypothetical protein
MTLNTTNLDNAPAEEVAVMPKEEKYSPLGLGKLSVKPFFSESDNMGLTAYEFVVFPGTAQTESIACLQDGKILRYVTGLDEFSQTVQRISDPKLKTARIKEIRKVVSYLEEHLVTNTVDPEDPEFWNKIKWLRPENAEFWETITMKLSNDPVHLNPANDPLDLIRVYAIEAGGYSLVATGWEDARAMAKPPKWYLDRESITVKTRTEAKKIRNKALGMLDTMYSEDPRKLMLVAKITDSYGHQYNYSTPLDVKYENMDNWINGKAGDKNELRAAKEFIANAELSMIDLKLKALCKDAAFYNTIAQKPDGNIYHMETNIPLGRNLNEAAEFFKNPVNEDVTNKLIEVIEGYWKE